MTLRPGSGQAAPVVVFAVGNPSRGDDALGPHLLARLEAWLEGQDRAEEFELIEDFQLNIEHALDLEGRRLALFIDAGVGTPAPYAFTRLEPASDLGASTHALEPGAVLRVFGQTSEQRPPPCFVLCIRGESFELGDPLSARAAAHGEAAFGLLQALLGDAREAAWSDLARPSFRQTGPGFPPN